MTDREQEIRARLFRTFGGPSYGENGETLQDAFVAVREDAKYLADLLAKERHSPKGNG